MCSKIRRKNKERKAGAACRDKLNKRESVGVDQAQEGAGGGGMEWPVLTFLGLGSGHRLRVMRAQESELP